MHSIIIIWILPHPGGGRSFSFPLLMQQNQQSLIWLNPLRRKVKQMRSFLFLSRKSLPGTNGRFFCFISNGFMQLWKWIGANLLAPVDIVHGKKRSHLSLLTHRALNYGYWPIMD
jgi:hypothetical protein